MLNNQNKDHEGGFKKSIEKYLNRENLENMSD